MGFLHKRLLVGVGLMVLVFQLHADVAFTLVASPRLRPGPLQNSRSVVAADLNGDGKVDLAAAISGWQDIAVLTNNGTGGFKSAPFAPSANGPQEVVAADFNGDGKRDLLSTGLNLNGFVLVTNSGDNYLFVSQPRVILTGYPNPDGVPSWVIPTDINTDGSIDLITQISTNTLLVLTNDGGGFFKIASSSSGGDYARAAALADVNGDGRMDVITANYYDTLTVVTNDGHLGFSLSGAYATGTQPSSVAAADVNGDHAVDLICANELSNTLSVFTNGGHGGFTLAATLSVGWRPSSVAAADINNDGWMDLIDAEVDSALRILTNNRAGGIAFAAAPSVGYSPISVIAPDLNGDGKLDLVCANESDGTLSILFNTSTFAPTLDFKPSGSNLVLTWPSSWTGWTLRESSDLAMTNWSPCVGVTTSGTNQSFTVLPEAGSRFFRLTAP